MLACYNSAFAPPSCTVTSCVTDEFNLKVTEDGVIKETFPNLSMDTASASYAESVINDPKTGSNLISFTDLLVGTRPDNQAVSLTGGDDGLTSLDDTDFIGSAAGPTGIRCLDTVQNMTLLIVPGRATSAVHNAMITYCEVTRDLFPLLGEHLGIRSSQEALQRVG
jgi:hypothetical protein